MKKIKRLLMFPLSLLMLLSMSSCMDMGNYWDDNFNPAAQDVTDDDIKNSKYCKSFGLTFIKPDGGSDSFDMFDMYNKSAINDLLSPMSEASVYNYFCIEVKDDGMLVEEVAFYFKSNPDDTAKSTKVNAYILDNKPSDFIKLQKICDDYESANPTDADKQANPNININKSDYKEPAAENAIASSTISVSQSWDSVTLSLNKEVKKNQFIVLQFDANTDINLVSSGDTKATNIIELKKEREDNRVKLMATALLIRVNKAE